MQLGLPKYRCHKIVGALKIDSIQPLTSGELLVMPSMTDLKSGYGVIIVPAKFAPKHDAARPQAGWYLVEYEDNYLFFSPPEAFESGYTRIEGE